MNGYDNSFIDFLRGAEQTAEEYAPAQYKWDGKEWIKRAVTSTGTSVGASLPIMAPTIALGAMGAPEIPAAFLSGYIGYLGERMQNSDEVYKKELERTGNVSEAYKNAKEFENLSMVELPFHFLGGLGAMKLLNAGKLGKGAVSKAVTGLLAEEAEEIPTEYIQGYNQAKVEGYKKSFTSYVKDNPEIGYDTFVATIGQSGLFYGAGKVMGIFSKDVVQPRTQFLTDIIQKNGIDYAKAVALKFYQTGVINEQSLQDLYNEIGKISNTTQNLSDMNMDDNASKLFIALNFDAAELKKNIEQNKDNELNPIYEQRLKEIKSQISDLSSGNLPYVVFNMPGGVKSTRVMSLSDFNKLEKSGNHENLIKASESVQVFNSEKENDRFQEMKKSLGNFNEVPSGFYQNELNLTEEEQNRKIELENALDSANTEKGTVTVGGSVMDIKQAQDELNKLINKSYATQESKGTQQASVTEGGIIQYPGTETVQDQATAEADISNRLGGSEKKVITSANINDIDGLSFEGVQKKVLDDAKRLFVSIGNIVKEGTGSELNVNIHTPESFKKAVIESGGTAQEAQSRAFYMSTDGSIHLNINNVESDTMLHEGFHPVLDFMANNNPSIIENLFTQLKGIKGAEDFVEKAETAYKEDGDITIKKEAITDFIANVANGAVKVDESNFDIIKNYIIEMLNKLGFNISKERILNLENAQQLKDLSKLITEKFTKGEQISKEELGVFSENLPTEQNPVATSGQLQFKKTIYGTSGIQKLPALDKEEFNEDVKSGRISITNPYQSLLGKFFSITFPDDLFTGEIMVNNEVVGYGFGGVFYVAKYGRKGFAWASVGKNSANNFVKQANESLKKNNGDGIVVLSKGEDIKHATSLQAKVAFINTLLKYAESKRDSEGIVKAIKSVYNVGNAKNPSTIIEYFNNYLSSGRMESGQTMFDAKGSFNNLMTQIIKEARPVMTSMLLNMGLKGDLYFDKTQLKKNVFLATTKGLSALYADMLQEDFLKGVPKGAIYAAIRFNSELEYVIDKSHPSYPFVIKTKDGSPVKLEVFEKTFNSYGKDVAVMGVERNSENAFGVVTTTKPNFQINPEMEGNKSEHSVNDKLNGYDAISGKKTPQFQRGIVPSGSGVPQGPKGPTGEVSKSESQSGEVRKTDQWFDTFMRKKMKRDFGEPMIETSTGKFVGLTNMRGQIMEINRRIKESSRATGELIKYVMTYLSLKSSDSQAKALALLDYAGRSGQLIKAYLTTRNSASSTSYQLVQDIEKRIFGGLSKRKNIVFGDQKWSEYVLFNHIIGYQRIISIQQQMEETYQQMLNEWEKIKPQFDEIQELQKRLNSAKDRMSSDEFNRLPRVQKAVIRDSINTIEKDIDSLNKKFAKNSKEYNKYKQRLIDNGMIDESGNYVGESLSREFAQGDITATQAYKNLTEIREVIGEKRFSDLINRSKEYSDFFNKMLKSRMEAGLISEDTYNYLSKFFYAPTRYINDVIANPILSMNIPTTSYRQEKQLKIKSLAGGSERLNISDYQGLMKATIYASEYSIAENRSTHRFYQLVEENPEVFDEIGIRIGVKYIPIKQKADINNLDKIDITTNQISEGKKKSGLKELPSGQKMLPYFGIEKVNRSVLNMDEVSMDETKPKPGEEALDAEVVTDENGNKLLAVQIPLKSGEAYIKTYENGQEKRIIVPAGFEESWSNRNYKTSPFLAFIGKITGSNIVRLIATGVNAVFGISQIIGDSITAYAATIEERKRVAPFLSIDFPVFFSKMVKPSFTEIATKSKDFQEATMYGATTNFYNGGSVMFERGLQGIEKKSLEEIVYTWKIPFLKQILLGTKKVTETMEQTTKVALYKMIRDKKIKEYIEEHGEEPTGIDLQDIRIEAGATARFTADFHRKGEWGGNANLIFPYLNAGIQIQRAVLAPFKKKNAWKILWATTEFSVLTTLIWLNSLGYFDDDDDELKMEKKKAYASLSEHDKDTKIPLYFIRSKQKFFSIKIPEFLQPINILVRKVIHNMYFEKNIKYTDAKFNEDFKGVIKSVAAEFPTLQVLNAEKTILSRNPSYSAYMKLFKNWDPYRQENVVEKRYEEEHYDYNEVSKLGKSPSENIYNKIGMATKGGIPTPFGRLFPEGISPRRLEAATKSIPLESNPITGWAMMGVSFATDDKKTFDERYGKTTFEKILKASGISQRFFKDGSKINQELVGMGIETIKDNNEFKDMLTSKAIRDYNERLEEMGRDKAWESIRKDFFSGEDFKSFNSKQKEIARNIFNTELKNIYLNKIDDPKINQIMYMRMPDEKIDAINYTFQTILEKESDRIKFINELYESGGLRSEGLWQRLSQRGNKYLADDTKNPEYDENVGKLKKLIDKVMESKQ